MSLPVSVLRCNSDYFKKKADSFVEFVKRKGVSFASTNHPSHVMRLEWYEKESDGKKKVVAMITESKKKNETIFNGQSRHLWQEFILLEQAKDKALELEKSGKTLGKNLKKIYEKNKGTCFYCLKPVALKDASTEHLIAVSRGGSNASDNLTLAHKQCNQEQANAPLMDKLKVREKNLIQQHMRNSSVPSHVSAPEPEFAWEGLVHKPLFEISPDSDLDPFLLLESETIKASVKKEPQC